MFYGKDSIENQFDPLLKKLEEQELFLFEPMPSWKEEKEGSKWTDEERKRLVKLLKNSYDVDVIANKLNRSEGGVKAEIKKIVYAKYIEGNDAEAISKELNIVYNNVKSMIKVSIDKECENDINNLEKENKLLRLKIENIRLHKKLASINKKS
jgi:IS30 family transposase